LRTLRAASLIADGVPELRRRSAKTTVLRDLRNASTPSSAPCLIVKSCFIPHRHYRE
jgi:hypothetical protein